MRRLLPTRFPGLLLGFAATANAAVYADSPPCSASIDPLDCRLHEILHFLDATAVLLVLALVAALVFLIGYYRRNRKSPPDASSGATSSKDDNQ